MLGTMCAVTVGHAYSDIEHVLNMLHKAYCSSAIAKCKVAGNMLVNKDIACAVETGCMDM